MTLVTRKHGKFEGARIISPEMQGAISFSNDCAHVVGVAETVLVAPSPKPATLYMAADAGSFRIRPGNYAPMLFDDGDVTNGTNTITVPIAHGRTTGEGPYRLMSATAIPAGLAINLDYYIIRVDDNDIQLALTRDDAYEGVVEEFSGDGTGNMELGGASDGATVGLGWANTLLVPDAATAALIGNYGAQLVGQGFLAIAAANEKITVVGFNATDQLTYWWS